MNNIINRKIMVNAAYQALSNDAREVATFELSTPPTNSDAVIMQAEGTEIPLVPGEWHQFQQVALSSIRVKGADGDMITVIGGTW